jgi:GNAT superfamily N-acetyltransferase
MRESVAALAGIIWREHFPSIIGAEQVEYMLEKFQSPAAIGEQMRSGATYYLVRDPAGTDVGYFAIVPRETEMFLSKIYLLKDSRGRGYARQIIGFVEGRARDMGLGRITLTVNKRNENSIRAYRKMGFTVYDEIAHDIGGGFVMDDYAMQKVLAPVER